MAWHIGNTTVRTPYRLKAALFSLVNSPLHGNLLGRDNEQAFADLLHDQGLVHAARREWSQEVDRSDLGRKWRAALSQLGFLTPHITRRHRYGVDQKLAPMVEGIPGLAGHPYEITPAGRLLVDAEDMISQQESFRRTLAAYRIPSILEGRYKYRQFSPLHFTLQVIRHLDSLGAEPFISFEEMALLVQRNTSNDGAAKVAKSIQTLRTTRDVAAGSVRQFYRHAYEAAVLEDDPNLDFDRIAVRANTLNDYADLNLRYLKATGLLKNRGRGIAVSPEHSELVKYLTDEAPVVLDNKSYLSQLWQGAALPTDERQTAVSVTQSLQQAIRQKGAEYEPIELASLDDEHLQIVRHQLEAQLHRMDEEEFADQQIHQVEEIVGFLDAILARGRKVLADGTVISIPRSDMAMYFEWAIWRAFLAIDSLENKPWEARRFPIDHDLLPVGHAPGGGPDMNFTFQDAIVVVEVTLTSSSRQEAAEGEPARRHVAHYAEANESDKAVYGLFIAPSVDTNTANTFRSGDWYRPDDSKTNVHIVPMQLKDFREFLKAIPQKQREAPRLLRDLLMECRMQANQEAPHWKNTISELTRRTARTLNTSN